MMLPLLSPAPSLPVWPAGGWRRCSPCWSQASGEPEMQGSNIYERRQRGKTMKSVIRWCYSCRVRLELILKSSAQIRKLKETSPKMIFEKKNLSDAHLRITFQKLSFATGSSSIKQTHVFPPYCKDNIWRELLWSCKEKMKKWIRCVSDSWSE